MGAPENSKILALDLNPYVGVPYALNGRKASGADCWGLVRLIYKEQMGIDLPSNAEIDGAEVDHVVEAIAKARENWLRVDSPRVGDVVLLRIMGKVAHIGIVSQQGKFLHCREGFDAAEESYTSGKWKHRVEGFYRYQVAPITVSARPHPMQARRIDCYLMPGESLLTLHNRVRAETSLSDSFPAEARIFIGGSEVPRELWKHCRPKAGTEITYRAVLRNSGAGRALLMVAIAVAAVYTGGLAAMAFTGATTVAGATASVGGAMVYAATAAAVNVIGALLVNAIFPVRPPEAPEVPGQGKQMSMLQGGSNQLSPYGAVPLLLGRMRYSATLAAKSYYETTASDTYLRMALLWGYGPMQITDLRIGDTPIGNYHEVEFQTLDGVDDDTDDKVRFNRLAGMDVEQISVGLNLEVAAPYITRTMTQEADEVAVVILIPQGLQQMPTEGGNSGDIEASTVRVSIQIRQVGAAVWNEAAEVVPSEVLKLSTAFYNTDDDAEIEEVYRWYRLSLNKYSQIILREGAVTSNPDANPSGALLERLQDETFGYGATFSRLPSYGPEEEPLWDICVFGDTVFVTIDRRNTTGGGTVTGCGLTMSGLRATIASGTVARAQADSVTITRQTEDAFSVSAKFKVVRGIYEVRVKRTDQNEADFRYPSGNKGQRINTTIFQSVTGYLNRKPINFSKTIAKTALRIRSSDQLNGTAPAVMGTCTSICKDYDHVDDEWIDRPTRNPASLLRWVYQGPMNARPEEDGRLDLEWFKDFHNWCRTKGFTFDKLITQSVSLDSLARDICAAGRASPVWLDGKRSGVIDRPRTVIAQHFTPHNSWGFSGQRVLPSLPHAFLVNFNNSKRGYQPDQMPVYADGYDVSNATRFETIELPGQTVPDTIYSHGRFHMGQALLRPERYTINADWENIVCTRGDLVRVNSDATLWGLDSARIKNWIDNTTLELDNEVPMTAATDYAIRVRTATGDSVVCNLAQVVTDDYYTTITLLDPIDDVDGAAGNLVQFGYPEMESVELIVESVTPGPDFTAQITLSDYSPAIYDLDDELIPPFESQITELPELAYTKLLQVPVVGNVISDENAVRLTGMSIGIGISVSFQLATNLPPSTNQIEGQISSAGANSGWNRVLPVPLGMDVYFPNVVQGSSYNIRFRYFNSLLGLYGPWTDTITHTVIGLSDLEPVESLQVATQNGVQKLSWGRPINGVLIPIDYEIRFGISSYNSSIVGITQNLEFQLLGDGQYWVSARYVTNDGSYTYSEWASVLVEGLGLVQNVLAIFDEKAQDWPGDKESMTVNASNNLVLIASGDLLEIDDLLDVPDLLILDGIVSEGSYTFPDDEIVDVGRVVNLGAAIEYTLTGQSVYEDLLGVVDLLAVPDLLYSADDASVYAVPQIATAGEDAVFGDWQNLVPGLITARYVKARLLVYSTDLSVRAVVSDLVLTVDVPDRTESYDITTSDVGTVAVTYAPEFNGGHGDTNTPLVQGTIINAQAGDDLVVTSQTTTGCVVEVYNAGSRVVRNVNILVQGY